MTARLLIAPLLVFFVAAAALAADPASVGQSAKGNVLTDQRGMTLYTFDRDTEGRSACTGQCAANWPPFAAPADAQPSGAYSVIVREDGSRQWAYHGKPLYTWIRDAKPGDISGDGFLNGAWHIAQP